MEVNPSLQQALSLELHMSATLTLLLWRQYLMLCHFAQQVAYFVSVHLLPKEGLLTLFWLGFFMYVKWLGEGSKFTPSLKSSKMNEAKIYTTSRKSYEVPEKVKKKIFE